MNLKKKFSDIFVLGDSLSDEGSLKYSLTDILNNLDIKSKKILNTIFLKHIKDVENYSYKFEFDDNYYNNSCFSDGKTAIKILADKYGFPLYSGYCESDVKIFKASSKLNERYGNNYAIVGGVSNPNQPEMFKNLNTFAYYLNRPLYWLFKKITYDLNSVTTIVEQTNWLISQNKEKLPTSLIFLSIGSNDLLNLNTILTKKPNINRHIEGISYLTKSCQNIKNSINELIKNGAKNIIVINSCDMTLLPYLSNVNSPQTNESIKELNMNFNEQLSQDIHKINLKNGNICFLFDLYTTFNDIYCYAKKKNFEIKSGKYHRGPINFYVDKINKKVIIKSCKIKDKNFDNKKDEYLFWDSIHPSKWLHNQIAKELISFIKNTKFN